MKHRITLYLLLVATLCIGCGERWSDTPPTSEGFDITGVWVMTKRTFPKGESYVLYLNDWTECQMYDANGSFFSFRLRSFGDNVFIAPIETGDYVFSDTLYVENGRVTPFQIINDSTMITKPVGDYYNCSVTWCKSSTMTESRKEEARKICRQARRNEKGDIIFDYVHSTGERKLENTIDKYRDVVVLLGIIVLLIVIYSIEMTKRERRAKQNLLAIKEELELRPALVGAAIKQVESKFLESDYYQMIRPRITAGENMSDEDWCEMERQINAVYVGFSRKLRSLYDFSDVEFQVCLLIKLGVSNNSIAAVINRAPNSVSSIRSRLYKKILGEKGGAKEWDDFVLSL